MLVSSSHTSRLMKIKYSHAIFETDKAVQLLIYKEHIWLPKKLIRYSKCDKYVIIPEWLVVEKKLMGVATVWLHIPKKEEVNYGQQPLEEIRFDPDECI